MDLSVLFLQHRPDTIKCIQRRPGSPVTKENGGEVVKIRREKVMKNSVE